MLPFSISYLNFQQQAKMEELRRAYSERHYIVSGAWRAWTNLGWVDTAADVELGGDAVITVEFISVMQRFCLTQYTKFAPDHLNYWSEYEAIEADHRNAIQVVNNYCEPDWRMWLARQVGEPLVNGTSGLGGLRWATDWITGENGAPIPDLKVGVEEAALSDTDQDVFGSEHLLGQWVFEDLTAMLSRLTATAAIGSGVYGDPVYKKEQILTSGSSHDAVDLGAANAFLGWSTTDLQRTPAQLLSDAIDNPDELLTHEELSESGVARIAKKYSAAQLKYAFASKVISGWNTYFGLSSGTEWFFWREAMDAHRSASGGAECIIIPDYLQDKQNMVQDIDVYYDSSERTHFTTTIFTEGISPLVWLTGGSAGDTVLPEWVAGVTADAWAIPAIEWTDMPTNPHVDTDGIPYEGQESDAEMWDVWWNGLLDSYGGWGEKPGFGWSSFYESNGTSTDYYGALIRFVLTYGNGYIPQMPVCFSDDVTWSIGVPVWDPPSPPEPCDSCDACDGDACNLCDGDACASCDTEICTYCNACESCDACEPTDLCVSGDWCDECDSCDGCNNCDTCETCNADDNCPACDSCDTCNGCDSCETCEPCEGEYDCGEVACEPCDYCNSCDTCDNCEMCDDCETCNANCDTCDHCESCNACEGCNAREICNGCEICERYDQCKSCEGCEDCDTCETCDTCNVDNCETCDGDACPTCDGD